MKKGLIRTHKDKSKEYQITKSPTMQTEKIKFEKYNAIGRDYIIVPESEITDSLNSFDGHRKLAIGLANRRFGIGADGVVILQNEKDLECIFLGFDGNVIPFSGSAFLCLSHYIFEKKLATDNAKVKTPIGKLTIKMVQDAPFVTEVSIGKGTVRNGTLNINVKNDKTGEEKNLPGKNVFLGEDNVVIYIDKEFDWNNNINMQNMLANIAQNILSNNNFSPQTTMNFVNYIDEKNLKVLSFKKNMGPVPISISGAASSVIVGINEKMLKNNIFVQFDSGKVLVKKGADGTFFIETETRKAGYGTGIIYL